MQLFKGARQGPTLLPWISSKELPTILCSASRIEHPCQHPLTFLPDSAFLFAILTKTHNNEAIGTKADCSNITYDNLGHGHIHLG